MAMTIHCDVVSAEEEIFSGLVEMLVATGDLGELGVSSAAVLMVPVCIYMVAHGLNQPCGQSGAVAPFPRAAGAASALSGFVMMLAAFAAGGWLGSHMDGSILPLTRGLGFCSVLVAAVAWLLVPRCALRQAPA